jgi:DNA modification methylase
MSVAGKTIYQALGRDPVHPFPARMAPDIALDILRSEKSGARVLDPMMGSGTVLALARANGHHAIGFDIDPLAVLISDVWITAIDPQEVRSRADIVLRKAVVIAESLASRDAYPRHADRSTCQFIDYWFDTRARRQLTSLAAAIGGVRDDVTRSALWCSFSRLIIAKQAGASLAMDLSHSRPHRVFETGPIVPFDKFRQSVDRVVENCVRKTARGRGPAARVHEGDARKLPLGKGTVDLVLTSPPYLNAIDYIRCSKFSLVWMGYPVEALGATRSRSVGTEMGDNCARKDKLVSEIIAGLVLKPKLAERQEAILARYVDDIRCVLSEASRVLVRGGKAIYVIGENTVRGTYVRNSRIITAAAELAGLKPQYTYTRTLPANRRYLPPPSHGSTTLNTRLRREVVLSFVK